MLRSPTTPPAIGTYNVSGTFTASASECSVVYQVSGTITQTSGGAGVGTTSLNLTGTNPSPSGMCGATHIADTQTINVAITNDACNFAQGTWSNSDGLNGNLSMTKPADAPDLYPTESTAAIAWLDSSGYPTIVIYEETIGAAYDMAGRQVYEALNGQPNDGCWFQGSTYQPWTLSGGGWYVGFYYFDNRYDYDYVGLLPAAVTYYRNQGRAPCLASIPQAMWMYTNAGSFQFFTDTLYANIPDGTNYGVSKNGVQAWRQYP